MLVDPEVVKESRYYLTLIMGMFLVLGLGGTVYRWQTDAAEADRIEFRFCINTIVGIDGLATPDQIEACAKATGGK